VPNPKFAISSTVAWVNEVGLANLKWQMLFRVTLVQGINLIENISKNNCAFKHEIANIKLRKVKILVQKIKHIINTEMEKSGRILAKFWRLWWCHLF